MIKDAFSFRCLCGMAFKDTRKLGVLNLELS